MCPYDLFSLRFASIWNVTCLCRLSAFEKRNNNHGNNAENMQSYPQGGGFSVCANDRSLLKNAGNTIGQARAIIALLREAPLCGSADSD